MIETTRSAKSYNTIEVLSMKNCEFVTFISILACNIAKDKTEAELNLLSAFFTQLGDTLATLSALDADKC